MTEYKLVPAEIIDRFPEINTSNYGHDDVCGLNEWGVELVLAYAAAAPAVQGEPVGRVKTVGGYPDESEHTVEWLCKYRDLKDGDLLYTHPQPAEQQPAPDVSGLVEALEYLMETYPASRHLQDTCSAAFANYRKQKDAGHDE